MMNRKRVIVTLFVLVFLFSLSAPANLGTSPYVPAIAQEDFPVEENWLFSDLPEGAEVFNNLEDYIDQLSDLHNESDIGTHSNPATLLHLDGVYDTMTSDNITVPEQLIEDEIENTSYIQAAYESWRLDLEGGWTAIDYDEISAELCVYGGTQASESLRVDIWDNNGWINVISDVMPGWNNVSIPSSLVAETLEMRFTGSNTGNTSVQSSWQIDAVLLHTWTVVYSSEFTQHGILQDLGNNLSRYIASVGEFNTWNPVDETWYRYLYDPVAKTVQIGNLTITHLEGGALSIDGDAGSKVGKLSWYIQAYYNDIWNNITLDNYQFVGFSKTDDSVTAHQRFWGSQGEMNVYLTYSYSGGFKTRVDITNNAAQDVPIRAIWAAQDVSGIQDNYELLHNDDGVLYGIQIEDAVFNWGDVLASDNPVPTNTALDVPNRRAAVIFGNQSTIIPSGYTASIDPTYSVAADSDDDQWNDWVIPTHDTDNVHNLIGYDGMIVRYKAQFRISLPLPQYTIIKNAYSTVWVVSSDSTKTGLVYRIDESNVGPLEDDDTMPDVDTDIHEHIVFNTITGARIFQISSLVQKQINLADWAEDNYIGLRIQGDGSEQEHSIEDISDGESSNEPQITIVFSLPATDWLTGWTYRQGHSIDGSTGADTNYQIKINVEYGVGSSADGTIYCNERSRTDFGDIRVTEADGETELAYWIEEKTDSDDATFWVKVSADLDTDQIIYVYYGNAGVSTTSNGVNTWILFDNFNDGSLDTTTRWDVQVGAVTETGGNLVLTSVSTSRGQIRAQSAFAHGVNSRQAVRAYTSTTSTYATYILHAASIDSQNLMTMYPTNTANQMAWFSRDDGVDSSVNTYVVTTTSWHVYEYLWTDTNLRSYQDATLENTKTDTYTPDDNQDLMVGFKEGITAPEVAYIDWVYVGKCISTEPAHLYWAEEETQPPVNDQAPTCSELDDTDNLYSMYKYYSIIVYVSDKDGYADIDYIHLILYPNDRSTYYWIMRYDEDTDSFSEWMDTNDYVDMTGSSASRSGNDIDATFEIRVHWNHPDLTDTDLRVVVYDALPEFDDDYYEVDWDVETRLEDDSSFSLDDGSGTATRGDYDTLDGIEASGAVSYLSSALHPSTDEIDVYVNCNDGTAVDNWEATNYEATGGTFSVDVDSDDAVGQDTYFLYAVVQGADHASSNLIYGGDPYVDYIADYMTFIATTTKTWTIVGETITVTLSGKYAYPDGNSDVPSVVWSNMDSGSVSYETTGLREWNYTSSGDNYGITKYFTTNASCVWDDVIFTSGPNYYWSQESDERVWFIWGVASAYEWDYNNSPLQSGFLIQSIVNDTDNAYATTYGGSIGGLAIGVFGPEYYAANITITIAVSTYVIVLWYQTVTVDILHSLQFVSWSLVPTDYYFWIQYQTNLMNASITIWDDVVDSGTLFSDRIYHSDLEGMHQIPIDDTVGNHNYTICITSYATHYDKDFTSDDYVWWYNFTNVVAAPVAYDTYIIILNSLFEVINFDTFEVYNNGTRIYHNVIQTIDTYVYNITVMNRFGDYVNSTAVFTADQDAAHDFVVFVDTYSFKFMNWYNGFLRVNVTRAGVTYSEIIMPMEIIEFNLFEETYTFTVDFLNGTTKYSHELEVNASTGYVITGDTLVDVLNMVNTVYAMTTSINVTLVQTNSSVVTISLNLLNINSTIYTQTVSLLANIVNVNSTIYDQTVSLIAELSNVNATLYAQTVTMLTNIANIDSDIVAQTVTLLASIENVNSTLYSQTVDIILELSYISSNVTAGFISVAADLLAIDSNLYSNFTSVTATLSLIDSSLLSNFTEVTSTLSAIGTNITSNYLSIVATLSVMDSSLLSNFTSITATLSMIDSALLSNFTELTAELLSVNSTIATQFLSVSATLSLLDSSLLSNFTAVSATLSMIDSNLLSNFTSVTSTLSAIGSNITTNYLSVAATLSMIDSQLLSNFTSIVSQLLSVNSSIATQFLLVLTNVESLNATMYLIDDPTHLNPLVLGYSLSDDYCDFTVVTSWHNATLSIHDNDVLMAGPTSELLSPIRYPLMSTSGTHNLSVFIDSGADSFWYNISYTVAEIIAFEIEDDDFDLTDNWVYIDIQTNYNNGTFYIWDNTTYVGASYEGSYPFAINNTIGLHVLTVLMNCSQGSLDATSQNRTGINGDLWEFLEFRYTINPVTFSITSLIMLQNNESIIVQGFWHTPNTTLTWIAYEAGVMIDSGVLTLTASGEYNAIYWMKNAPTMFNNLTLSITADGSTINLHSYSFVLDSATYLTTIIGGRDVYEGDNFFEGDITHENPPGFYITAETAAVIAVCGVFIAFLAYLFSDRVLKKKRLDVESEGS